MNFRMGFCMNVRVIFFWRFRLDETAEKNPYKNPYKNSYTTFAASEQLVTRAFFHALSWKGWGGGGEWGGLETGLGWGRWDEGCLSMGTESALQY